MTPETLITSWLQHPWPELMARGECIVGELLPAILIGAGAARIVSFVFWTARGR